MTFFSPLLAALDRTLDRLALASGRRLLVAFSGGPDSLALLVALRRAAPRRSLSVHAAHADHGLDAGAAQRAQHARALAAALGLPCHLERLDPQAIRAHPQGLEAGARSARYRALRACADHIGAPFVLTAHHADDQAETVLLRLAAGSGWAGLGAMAGQRGWLLRPWLGLRRQQLRAALAETGLRANDDPSNRDTSRARNAVRRDLLPRLEARDPQVVARLCRLAQAARAARQRLARRLRETLALSAEGTGVWSLDRGALAALPSTLVAPALDLLARAARRSYPPAASVRHELARQLGRDSAIGCAAGEGWRLAGDSRRLRLIPPGLAVAPFAYTLAVPGSVRVGALAITVTVRRSAIACWMFEPAQRRVALGERFARAGDFGVRSRQPGDRLRPLGSAGQRRLKDVLIDRRVPLHARDRLPVITAGDQIACIPGVVLDHRFRVRGSDRWAWVVEFSGGNLSPPQAVSSQRARCLANDKPFASR